MSVYVDLPRHKYGRMIMGHMLADSEKELHRMADAIGVQRKWFQRNASTPHYDICKSKHRLALGKGAIFLDRQEFVAKLRHIKQLIAKKEW